MTQMTFHFLWHWSLKSRPESLWPYVSDTDRFRAVTGVPAAQYTEEPLPEGGSRRIGKVRMYGFPISWEEKSFEWIYGREFKENLAYFEGPVRSNRVMMHLEPRSDGGTDLQYEVWAEVGNILGYLAIPLQIGVLMRTLFKRAFHQADSYVQAQAPQPFVTTQTPISTAGRSRIRDISAQLVRAGIDTKLVNRLVDHVSNSPDDQLLRMRPFAYADMWKTDRMQTLELFLRASKLGLLDLSWDMICPACRGAKHRHEHLDDVTHEAYCPSCNINYEVDFARSVEATFRLNPAIKAVKYVEYCIGGPHNTPHVLAQQVLAPGETRKLVLLMEPGRYRIAAPSGKPPKTITLDDMLAVTQDQAFFTVDSKSKTQATTVELHDDHLHIEPAELGGSIITLTLINETQRQRKIMIAESEWSDQATTAAEITSLQAFRDLYSSEALRPGESIRVESLAVLFTDLKGSTSMYQSLGDAPAFGHVMDHFKILRERVASNHGGLIKTIGDAIMAVFPDPVNAVHAGVEILQDFQRYNEEHTTNPLIIKMGMNQGACIAVTLNDRLDYFGSMVNLAARLEGQSQGNEVVLSNSMISDPAVMEYLAEHQLPIETFEAGLKGFTDSFMLHRLRLPKHNIELASVVNR